jgi:hypothetical protein
MQIIFVAYFNTPLGKKERKKKESILRQLVFGQELQYGALQYAFFDAKHHDIESFNKANNCLN